MLSCCCKLKDFLPSPSNLLPLALLQRRLDSEGERKRERKQHIRRAKGNERKEVQKIRESFLLFLWQYQFFLTQWRALCHCFLYNIDEFLVEWVLGF